jgi:hypothetical protein
MGEPLHVGCGDPALANPTTGIVGCCARATKATRLRRRSA